MPKKKIVSSSKCRGKDSWEVSDADEPEHCFKALNSVWIKVKVMLQSLDIPRQFHEVVTWTGSPCMRVRDFNSCFDAIIVWTGAMEPGMITTPHEDLDLCLDQFLLGMTKVTGPVKGQGVPNLPPALVLHGMRETTSQAAGPPVLEQMVRQLMHIAGLRVLGRTPRAQQGLFLDPTVLNDGSFGFAAIDLI
ncbi:UNVERIFIED_CONTAM: hypothetical protein Sindi_0529200 [Sesamum indicum]